MIRVVVLHTTFLYWIPWMGWLCCNELLIYWKSFYFYIFISILSHQEPLHLGIHSSKYLREREKKKAKIRHNMSDWVSSMQRCWMEGKVGLIQGAQSSTGALDDRDYRFLLFQAPKWGVFRGPKPCSAAGILNKWKTQSLFKTVITHPVQEALVLSWSQVQHSTR